MTPDEFMTRFGVRATPTHLIDYVTHTEPTASSGSQELIRRLWVVVFEHADHTYGDQRVLSIDYATSTSVGPNELNVAEVLEFTLRDAQDGALSFESYVAEYGNIPPVDRGQAVLSAAQPPTTLYGRWVALVALRHRVLGWASSAQMRMAVDEVAPA